tara:strand:- start:864 stop:1082 length:219 start_codon:yes stop_codon:yes gene_type:complete
MTFAEYHKKWGRIEDFRNKITERTSGKVILLSDKRVCFQVAGQIVAIKECGESPVKDIVRLMMFWKRLGADA